MAAKTQYQLMLGNGAAHTAAKSTYHLPKQWFNGLARVGADQGWVMDDSNSATWQQIAQMANSGNTQGAIDQANQLAAKGAYGGYYDDAGNYWGFAQGYTGGANASMQPVIGGKILTPKGLEYENTNIWLTPDGKALTAGANGVLTDNGETWGTTDTNPYALTGRYFEEHGTTPRSIVDVVGDNLKGYSWSDRPAGGYYANPELNTLEGNLTRLAEWQANPDADPAYIAELQSTIQKQQSATPYQQALDQYVPQSQPTMNYEEYLERYGGQPTQAPSAPGLYDPESDATWQEYLARYEGAEAPTWQGTDYVRRRDEAAERAAASFSYDPETDPVYGSYRKAYTREGQRAMEDTLGRYAAMTGGMPSTAAVTAASQAGDDYAAKLADKLPELYQQAYQRYLQEYQRQMGLAGAYDDYDREAYARYRDELDQWNKDRSFDYGAARDSQTAGRQKNETEYNRYLDAVDQWNKDRSFAYTRARDAVSDQRYDAEWAQKLREYANAQDWKAAEWEQYLREYGDKLSRQEQEWAYQQLRDAMGDARYADALRYDRAQDERNWQRQSAQDEESAAEAAYARALSAAKLAAQYGDYRGLEALGISPNEENLRRLAIAEAGRLTPVGSGSVRSAGGSGSGGGEREEYSVSTVNAAYKAYLDGDRSDLTLRILGSAGLPVSGSVPEGGEPEGEYAVMDRVLADMQAQGRPWNQLLVELDGELRDERITREEYEALRQKYVNRGLEDGVGNLEGVVHRDGSPMSAGYSGVWRTVRDLADRQKKEEALAAMRRAYDAGTIHEYEIDVMMDQLGW